MTPLPPPGSAGAVVLARPVDWSDVGLTPEWVRNVVATVRAEHADEIHPEHDPLTGVYPGSEVRRCAVCDVRVWVGPRSLAAVEAGALVGCYRCIIAAQGYGALEHMTTLGNPDVARRPGGAA